MQRKDRHAASRPILRPLTAAVAAVLGAGYAPNVLHAQGSNELEEVIVTASRRETTVQELPFNIAVVTGDTLEQQRLTNLNELARWVPGLTVAEQGPRNAELLTVRGLNVSSLDAGEFLGNTGGQTVSTYLGDIPVYVDFRMKDLERVEVLIGPQGTLYGAGTLGGAVRYIPRAPDTENVTISAQGSLFSLAHSDGTGYDTDFALNVPIVEGKLAFRAALSYLDDPGFIDYSYVVREPGVSNPQPDLTNPADVAQNLRRVEDADWQQTSSGRLALLWEATDSVRATLNYYFQDQEAGSRTINHRHAFGTGPYESANRYLEPNDRENRLVSLEVVADLGFAELTSATGFSEYDSLGQRDQTDLLLDFLWGYEQFPSFSSFTREITNEERTNQELRLVSTGTGPWGWIVGAYYNEFELDASSEEFTPNYPEFAFGVTPPQGDLEYLQLTTQTLSEQAIFGEASYQVTDRLQIAFGGRFYEFEDERAIQVEAPFFDWVSADGNVADDSGFLGKLNASYDFNDNVMGYATLSEGYRMGGVNPIANCPQPVPAGASCTLPHEVHYEPDRTTNFEVGMHGSWRGGALLVNAAVFQIDWEDIQTGSRTENGANPITVNGNDARSRGLEVAMQNRIGNNWSLSATYAYVDAELTEDAPGLVNGADAFDSDRLSGTPEHQGSVYLNYFRPLSNGWMLDAGYGVSFTSDVLTKVGLRSDGEALGGYAVHNLSVGLGRDRWSARLFAANLTDKFAETGVRQDPSFIRDVNGFDLRRYYRYVLRPRSVGLEFRYRFGE